MMKYVLTTTALTLACAACGGDGGATLQLMDAPPDGVTAVKITVAAMQVHLAKSDGPDSSDPLDTSIDDDDRWISLSVNRQIDLVQHQGESAADVLGQLPLPEGKITQIRLVIDTAAADSNVATYNGNDCNLDVGKVAKKGIKINHPFKAFVSEPGKDYDVFVDFELDKSMKAKDGCFELEPKLKLHKVKLDGIDQPI
jgi:hypothetical protein